MIGYGDVLLKEIIWVYLFKYGFLWKSEFGEGIFLLVFDKVDFLCKMKRI